MQKHPVDAPGDLPGTDLRQRGHGAGRLEDAGHLTGETWKKKDPALPVWFEFFSCCFLFKGKKRRNLGILGKNLGCLGKNLNQEAW